MQTTANGNNNNNNNNNNNSNYTKRFVEIVIIH